MSGARNRRFPRTARAMPEAGPTIEREKIRHRRPNDMVLDGGQGPVSRRALLTDDVDPPDHAEQTFDGGDVDWRDHGEAAAPTEDWDYEPEDDWVLDGDGDDDGETDGRRFDDEASDAYDGEDSGVVWEEDGYDDQRLDDDPDELTFGEENHHRGLGSAPEVELAGRRDVRPKPPRPAPPSRAGTRQPSEARKRPPSRQGRPGWEAEDRMDVVHTPPSGEAVHGLRPREPRPAMDATAARPAENGRFSRTRATLGVVEGGGDSQVLQQPRSGPSQRRRKAQPSTPSTRYAGRQQPGLRYGRARGIGLIKVAALILLLGAGGWLVVQLLGAGGTQPMLDRLTSLLPLPTATRTADDTSFGGQQSTGAVSPEQALSDLERQVLQQEEAPPAADSPPIPKLKPLPGATRSLSTDAPEDETRLAARDGADAAGGEPSIFEQLWRYLSPG